MNSGTLCLWNECHPVWICSHCRILCILALMLHSHGIRQMVDGKLDDILVNENRTVKCDEAPRMPATVQSYNILTFCCPPQQNLQPDVT